MSDDFNSVKVGDKVSRYIGNLPLMDLAVTAIDEFIHCGPWKFSKKNGAEIDEDLGWNEENSGSYITFADENPVITLNVTDYQIGPITAGPEDYTVKGTLHITGYQHIGHDPGAGESHNAFTVSEFGKVVAAYRGDCVFRIRAEDSDGRRDWLCAGDSDLPRNFKTALAAQFAARVEGLRNYDIYVASSDQMCLQDPTFLFRMSE
jgi:hypothetical protein